MRAVVLAFAVLLTSFGVAYGHARLVRSEPAAGAVVDKAQRIVLEFNTPVEQRFGTFVLELADGSTRSLAAAGEGVATRIELSVGALAPGKYRLRWSVVSGDGHRIKGTLAFAVGPGR